MLSCKRPMRWEPDVIGKEGMVAQRREHQSENPPSKNQPQKRKKYDNPMSKTSQKPTKKKRRTIFAIGFPGRSTPGITCANTFVESYSLRRRWTKIQSHPANPKPPASNNPYPIPKRTSRTSTTNDTRRATGFQPSHQPIAFPTNNNNKRTIAISQPLFTT